MDIVHSEGMNAITWCGITYCESGWIKHPEWRMIHMNGMKSKGHCCINTSYGQAFIGMVLEFFEKFGLDGIYFDGACFDGLPSGKILGCICPSCRRKFKIETGYPYPTAVNFEDKAFRCWVKWRFNMFSAYLKKLVDTIHKYYPDKVITINHYHRYNPNAWHTACPLDVFECDIVTGSEAMQHMDHSSFSSKMAVAYGRPVDIWTPIARWKMGEDWQFHEPKALMHHAATCITFGAFPSFGFETDVPKGSLPASAKFFLKPLAKFLRKRAPYVEIESANPVALHLSQQTETFFFGRNPNSPGFGWYWESLMGWDQMLNETGLGTDIIFDGHLNTERLGRYKTVILPLSLCLTEEQGQALKVYVNNGGVLVLGPWSGRLDAEGASGKGAGVLAELRAVKEGAVATAVSFARKSVYLESKSLALPSIHGFAVNTMMAEQQVVDRAQILMSAGEKSAVAKRRYGKGYVIDLAADWGASFNCLPSSPMRTVLISMLTDTAVFPVIVKAPASVSTALRREKDGSYLVHLHNCPATVHHQGYETGDCYLPVVPRDVIPVCDVSIEVREFMIGAAKRLVENPGNLSVEKKGAVSNIRLERLDLHEIVRICRK